MTVKLAVTKNRNKFFAASGALLAVCIFSVVIFGFNLGIDFAGGSVAQFELHTGFDTAEALSLMEPFDPQATITAAGDNSTSVVINSAISFSEEQKAAIFGAFREKYSLEDEDMLSFSAISPSMGKDLQRQALTATLVTVVLILVYITVRFEIMFAVASIITLINDICVAAGLYAIFGMPVNSSFIAAMLTILGYSINNTIIVFDRIRENRKTSGSNLESTVKNLVDVSVNQMFTRSLNTTLTTVLAILALFVFGVPSVREFVLPMIIGFLSGFYSSVFLAGNIWSTLVMASNRRKAAAVKVKKR